MKYNGNIALNEIVETVEELIKFKTTPSNFIEFEKAVNYIENYFAGTSIKIKKHYFNNFPALYISTKDTIHASIMMQAHVDVVDGKDSQFLPIYKDGKMYGRGTSDMKGFVAIAMKLIREFENHPSNCNLALILTFDEEIGSENGAKKMAELGYTGDLIINGDAGYNHSVIYGEKGILKINLKVEATPGRHPFPWEGKNAFELLNEDYNTITSLFPNNNTSTKDDNWHTTYSIYDIKVENKNMYPPHFAEAKMNFYFTEAMQVDEFLEFIKTNVKHCSIQKFRGSDRVFIDKNSSSITLLHEIMSSHFKRPIAIRTENGSSDARFYAHKNIPVAIIKPVGYDMHGENECLDVDELLPFYYSLKEFILASNEKRIQKSNCELVDAK